MKTIEMYAREGSVKGTFTVDDEDYERVSAHRWSMNTTGYVHSGLGSLSRWLMNCADNTKVVDHIDGDRTNNCRSNLRIATHSLNSHNRSRNANPENPFTGVVLLKGRWRATFCGRSCGLYDSAEHAALAYNHYATLKYGAEANLNNVAEDPQFVLKEVVRRGKRGEGSVHFDKAAGKWRGQLQMQGKTKWLGYQDTKEEAEQVLREYCDNVNATREAAHMAMPIQRNRDGIAIIEANSGNSKVEVLVDDNMWHKLRKRAWHYEEGLYAKNRGGSMHEVVMGAKAAPGLVVDHINNDRYDNRRENLRYATRSQNAQNRIRPSTSQLPRGVNPTKQGRFNAMISFEGKTYYLGTYLTPEEAAAKYDCKALELYGPCAKINRGAVSRTEDPAVVVPHVSSGVDLG
jgi:hypothetical protein